MPSQEPLDNFFQIKLLASPTRMNDFTFDPSQSKEYYINLGFREVQVAAKYFFTQVIGNQIQAKRKQYGIKVNFSGTIHSVMGDTFSSITTTISASAPSYKLWGESQLVVTSSRTRKQQNTIFVGDKRDTIEGLVRSLTKKDQWIDYQEKVLELAIVKRDGSLNSSMMDQSAFPFRIADYTLPQDRTSAVYMVTSIKKTDIVHIDTTFCLRSKLKYHNYKLIKNH